MLRKFSVVICAACLICALGAGAALAQEGKSFGEIWNAKSETEKKDFVLGIATGVRMVCGDWAIGIGKDKTVEVNKAFGECFTTYFNAPTESMYNAMNDLYQDKLNAYIPFDGMFRIASVKAGGGKYDDILRDARTYAEKLKQEMKDGPKSAAPAPSKQPQSKSKK